MQKKDPKVSVIYVNYKSDKDLIESIKSIKSSATKASCETIVVDNACSNKLRRNLKKYYPKCIYINSGKNIGFGAGNNLGAKKATGKYLLFLNPDTRVTNDSIDHLASFLDRHRKTAAVSPNLYQSNDVLYDQFGTETLTPYKAIFTQTLIDKYMPSNRVSQKYWLRNIQKNKIRKVGAVSGSAFMIKKEIFERIGGFDDRIFMYFEEQDLGKRIHDVGMDSYIIPSSKIIHKGNKKQSKELKKIYFDSRKYYFSKHYGKTWAYLIDFISRINLSDLLAFIIILLSLVLRFYKKNDIFIFNGELGNYYLEIKTHILDGSLPLKGPQTSHPWLSFGPLYYWIMIPLFLIFGFDPKVPSYFMALVGVAGVMMNYVFIKKLLNKNVALLSSYILAIAYPFIQLSLGSMFFGFVIPLFYPFLYFLVRSVQKDPKYIIPSAFFLGLMLNFHLTPLILIPGVVAYLYIYKIKIKFTIILRSIIAILIPFIPIIIYDLKSGYQMLKNMILWIPYRIAGFFGLYPKNNANFEVLSGNVTSLSDYFVKTLAGENNKLFMLVLVFSMISIYYFAILSFKKRQKYKTEVAILILLAVGYAGLFLHGDPPYHYYLPIYSLPAIIYAYFLVKHIRNKGKLWIGLIIAIFTFNMLYYYFSENWFYKNKYLVDKNGYVPYLMQNYVSRKIIFEADGQYYNLARVGKEDQFERNFAQNYQYLLWLYGNEPVKVGDQIIKENEDAVYKFTIYENSKDLPESLGEYYLVGDVAILKEEITESE